MDEIVLRDVADEVAVAGAVHIDAVERDAAARGWADAHDGVEQRRLAGAAGADDRHKLARRHRQLDVAQERAAAPCDANAVDDDPEPLRWEQLRL